MDVSIREESSRVTFSLYLTICESLYSMVYLLVLCQLVTS